MPLIPSIEAPKIADLSRKPEWLKVRLPGSGRYGEVMKSVRRFQLHTVCQSARCPNVGECWERGTATFMILGDICTRACGFCAVESGTPAPVDVSEPLRVADAVVLLRLKYAVITSVTRDDLTDGGASIFAATVHEIRQRIPECKIEVLIPDFEGDEKALRLVCDAAPDVLNHNIETVSRLYPSVRTQARYWRSLQLLSRASSLGMRTKSGFMVGLGETREEVVRTMRDLREVSCELLTIGQYLQPTPACLPVIEFVSPEIFAEYRNVGLELGFRHVESAPLVRSSYHADAGGAGL